MGIAEGMDVTHGPRDLCCGDIEDFRRRRNIEVSRGAGLDPGIPALIDERRKPADFELQADHDEQIRFLQLQHEAGLGLDEVRILIAPGDGLGGRAVTADVSGNRGQIFGGCDYVDLRSCAGAAHRER